MKKKILSAGVLVCMLVFIFTVVLMSCGSTRWREPKVLTGTGQGYGGDIVVEVDVQENRVVATRMIRNNETPTFWNLPFSRISSAVINHGSLNVDSVSGATMSFMGVMGAIIDALEQAGFNINAMLAVPKPEHTPHASAMAADVVVIGGGGAGLAAAVQASQLGASVILVEKTEMLGGNTILAGSIFQIAGNPNQVRDFGNIDTPELHAMQTWVGGNKIANKDLLRVMTNRALPTANWLADLGVRWDTRLTTGAGTTFPRTYVVDGYLGTEWITTLRRYAERPINRVEILTATRATEIIMEGGRAVGVRAEGRYGDTYNITARNGVVIATGGFAKNIEMRMHYDEIWGPMGHQLTANIPNTNNVGMDGDGIRMAQAAGADVVDMGQIQLLNFGDPYSGSPFNFAGGIMFSINEQGERFLNENWRRDDMTFATFRQTNNRCFWINDTPNLMITQANADRLVSIGNAFRGDTIDELVANINAGLGINMDPRTLSATVAEFARLVATGETDEFGRNFEAYPLGSMVTPPFYASPRVPTVHHTMGGIKIDINTRVMHTNGQPIQRLFAAGEVTGGIHGANRLGGNAVADVFVFGRIAGHNAFMVNGPLSVPAAYPRGSFPPDSVWFNNATDIDRDW